MEIDGRSFYHEIYKISREKNPKIAGDDGIWYYDFVFDGNGDTAYMSCYTNEEYSKKHATYEYFLVSEEVDKSYFGTEQFNSPDYTTFTER